MKPEKFILIPVLIFLISSCSLFEALENKSEQEKTIELLTTGGVWKLDSATWKIESNAPGLSVTLNDSLFLNYGTWEFQSPENPKNPGFTAGYLIHKYVKKGVNKTDTLAWTPYNFGSTLDNSDTYLTIFYPDPSLLVRDIVVDDMQFTFSYQKKERNLVRITGTYGFSVGVATTIKHTRQYRLTR